MENSPNHLISGQFYAPLDTAKKQHRLIRFIGGRRELAWELGTFSLVDEQPLTALSYCWGQSRDYKPIILNGHEFLVRPNLYSFLVQMASENRRDWFFVDAICINQDDVPEKSVQVTYMGEIYRKANEVLAWIYLEDTDDPKIIKRAEIERNVRELQVKEKAKIAEGTDLEPDERKLLDSLIQLAWQLAASSDYWSRLWIVQEILLAKKLTIRWYSLTFEWSDILTLQIQGVDIPSIQLSEDGRPLKPHALTTIRKAGLFEYEHMPNSAENAIMCKQLWYWQNSAGRDLQAAKLLAFHEAVAFFSAQLCKVAHDNVFALLGIAECSIRPDYNMPLLQLYTSTLYNYMLSLWSQRPATRTNSTKLNNWATLISLGLDYDKLRSLGETLMHAFQLDPFQEVVFLIAYHVCKRFSPDAVMLAQQGLASNWLLHTQYTKLEFGAAAGDIVKRKWYESQDRALNRFHNDLLDRSYKALDRQAKFEKAGKELKAPIHQQLEGPAKDGRVMPYPVWVQVTNSVCDEIWSRWEMQDQHSIA